jgi:cell wall-associated NlpC family hydrolase
VGESLTFVEESRAGDLAFFENAEGKIVHVGIMLENQRIIHASGKVRIDTLDSTGIFNKELNKHTHKLRVIKNVL